MHKKLINDLHNIAFGIVSSVGNYYVNVEKKKQKKKNTREICTCFPNRRRVERGREREEKMYKKSFTEEILTMKSVLYLSSKRRELEIKASR